MKLNKIFTLLLTSMVLTGKAYALPSPAAPTLPEATTNETTNTNTEAGKTIVPLDLRGWSVDGIAEKTPAASNSGNIQTNGWAFYTSAIQAQGAISDETRKVTSATGIEYKLAPYNQPNMSVVSTWLGDVELTLSSPISAEEIYVLGASVGAGKITVEAIYSDGTRSTATAINFNDWAAIAATNKAVSGLGRIKRNANTQYQADEIPEDYNYALSEGKAATDKTKQITKLLFKDKDSSGYPLLMAVSAKIESVSTGIAQNVNQEGAKLIGVFNVNGVKLDAPSKGINILKYSDGTSRKMFVK